MYVVAPLPDENTTLSTSEDVEEQEETDSPPKTSSERQTEYELGQSLFASGEREAALKAFLRSLHGLEPGSDLFPGLPLCLRAVATCHYEDGNYLQVDLLSVL